MIRISLIYCVLNNNAFKLYLIEHIGGYEYLTVSFDSHFKEMWLEPIIISKLNYRKIEFYSLNV